MVTFLNKTNKALIKEKMQNVSFTFTPKHTFSSTLKIKAPIFSNPKTIALNYAVYVKMSVSHTLVK